MNISGTDVLTPYVMLRLMNINSSNSSSRSSSSSRVIASGPATILAQDSVALSFAPPSPPFK